MEGQRCHGEADICGRPSCTAQVMCGPDARLIEPTDALILSNEPGFAGAI